jgi:hypothetical protein
MSETPPPSPADPLQAQTAHERRDRIEDVVAHILAVLVILGFFAVIFVLLLGFVDLKQPTIATLAGTALGYAVGKVDPVLTRYFISRSQTRRFHSSDNPPLPPQP